MKLKIFKKIIILSAIFLPIVSFAATAEQVAGRILDILKPLIGIIIGLGLLVFLWNVLKLAFAEKEDDRKKAKQFMVWGIVALFVMVSIWGLVYLLSDIFFGGQSPGVDALSKETNSLQEVPASTQSGSSGSTPFDRVVNNIINIIAQIIPYMIVGGVLIFIWGVFNYIRQENVEKKGQAAAFMGWGIVMIFIMTSVWGLVIMIGDTLGISALNQENVTTQKINPESLIKR